MDNDRAEFKRLEPIARDRGFILRKLTKTQQRDYYPESTYALVECEAHGGGCTRELAAEDGPSHSRLHAIVFDGSIADIAAHLEKLG